MEYAGEFLNLCYEKTICILGLQGFMQSLEDINPDVQWMLLGKIQSFRAAQVCVITAAPSGRKCMQ